MHWAFIRYYFEIFFIGPDKEGIQGLFGTEGAVHLCPVSFSCRAGE